MKINNVGVQRMISATLILLGVYVLCGWALGQETMVRILPGSVAMGLNTAVMFVVTGLCLFPVNASRTYLRIQRILPWLLVILPSLILIEHALDRSLGVDWPALHALVKDGNPRPGRVAPNTCLAFIFAAIALIISPRASNSKALRVALTALSGATLFIGLTALIGYVLNLEGMYRIAKYNRMAAPTAVAVTLMGIALWLRLNQVARRSDSADRPDKRITRASAIVLTIVTLLTGLLGFSVLKQGFEQTLSETLLRATKNYATSFSNIIHQQIEFVNIIASRPALQNHLERINAAPQDREALGLIEGVAKSFLARGLSGIRFVNAKGEDLLTVGTLVRQDAAMAIPLQGAEKQVFLLWHNGFILWIEKSIVHDGRVIGTLIAEQHLDMLTKMLHEAQDGSGSTDTLICGRDKNDALCFPSRY
jgi:hypothetical protein